MSEVHGMSQREGSVLTYVRYGGEVYSPVVEKGQADMIVGFEELELARNIEHLRNDGKGVVVMNTTQVNPITVLAALEKYPEGIEVIVKRYAGHLLTLDFTVEAEKLGSAKVMNIILLGTLVKSMDLMEIDWDQIIAENVKPQFVELNQAALRHGMSLI